MARKHSAGTGRSFAHRPPTFRVTCKTCGQVQTLPVRPPPGIDMNCVDCLTAKKRAAARA